MNSETKVSNRLIYNYLDTMVNSFFKILPIRESEAESLPVYLTSLQHELLGCEGLIHELNDDARFMRLMVMVQYLLDHPEASIADVKREVFKAIRICTQLRDQYGEAEDA